MNKLKSLQKQVGVQAGIAVAVLVVTGGIMMATGSMSTGATTRKTNAESGRTQDQSQLDNMKSQLSKSGDAEKRFVDIQLAHGNADFTSSSDAIKEWLRNAKTQYRFADSFKLTLALDKKSERPEFSGMNFDVMVREPMKLDLDAMSDTHIYSFIDAMSRSTPGFVRVNKMVLKRKTDMTAMSYRMMLTGSNADFVNAQLEFTWVGVQPKEEGATGGAPMNPGAMP